MNIKIPEILAKIYGISEKRKIMLYNRLKFMLKSRKNQLPYNQKIEVNIGNDPSYNEQQEKKLTEEKRIMERATMQNEIIQRFKDSGGNGEFMYDALDPGNFIAKARENLRRVDQSFENCFSNFFKTPSEIKLANNRKRIRNSKSEKILPKMATRDSLLASLKNLKKMDFMKKHNTTRILRTMQSSKLGAPKMGTSLRDFRINRNKNNLSYFWTARKNKNNGSLMRFKSTRSKILETGDTGSHLRSTITNEKEMYIKKGDLTRAINFNFVGRRGSYAERRPGNLEQLKMRLKMKGRDTTFESSPKNAREGDRLYDLLSQDDHS